MREQPSNTAVEQFETKHNRDVTEEFDESGPVAGCPIATCLVYSDN